MSRRDAFPIDVLVKAQMKFCPPARINPAGKWPQLQSFQKDVMIKHFAIKSYLSHLESLRTVYHYSRWDLDAVREKHESLIVFAWENGAGNAIIKAYKNALKTFMTMHNLGTRPDGSYFQSTYGEPDYDDNIREGN